MIINVGDIVLTTDTDSLTGKQTPVEQVKVTSITDDGQIIRGYYISDGEPAYLYADEVAEIITNKKKLAQVIEFKKTC